MLGKKSSVAPILAFLKENDVSKYSYNTYLYQNKIMVVHVPQAQNQFFFFWGGGGAVGKGEEREGVWKGSLDNRQQQSHSPLQVNLRKSSDRAMSGRLKCMLKRDTGKRFL